MAELKPAPSAAKAPVAAGDDGIRPVFGGLG